MNVIDTINLSGVPLNIYEGPIAVSVSGGADSALLLYHVMKHKKDCDITIISISSQALDRENSYAAKNIVEQCITLTRNFNVSHKISYFTWYEIEYNEYINSKGGMIYTGITQNPPKYVTDTFFQQVTQFDRDPEKTKETVYGNYYTPFYNIDKKKIAEMYKEDNLIETIFPLTRSCEYDPRNNFFYGVPNPKSAHCGVCWWCQERKWAFGKL